MGRTRTGPATAWTQVNRRDPARTDRRRYSRNGRRSQDFPGYLERLAWVFSVYVAYLAIRVLPAALRRLWHRSPA